MKIVVYFFLIFFSLKCFSQTKQQVELNFKWNDADFFSGVTYKPLFSKNVDSQQRISFEPFVSLQTGIIRTFFQKRFYPTVSVGSSFYFYEKKYFSVGPRLSVDYMLLNVNRINNDFLHRTHYTIGYQFKIGKDAFYFTQHTAIGLKHEFWKNTFSDAYTRHTGMLLELNVGLLYMFRNNMVKTKAVK